MVKRYLDLKAPNTVESTTSSCLPEKPLPVFLTQSQERASPFKVKFAFHSLAPHCVIILSAKPQSPLSGIISMCMQSSRLLPTQVSRLSTTPVSAPLDRSCTPPWDLATGMLRFELSRQSSSVFALPSPSLRGRVGTAILTKATDVLPEAQHGWRRYAVTSSTTSTPPACPSISLPPDYSTSFFNMPVIRGSQNVSQWISCL